MSSKVCLWSWTIIRESLLASCSVIFLGRQQFCRFFSHAVSRYFFRNLETARSDPPTNRLTSLARCLSRTRVKVSYFCSLLVSFAMCCRPPNPELIKNDSNWRLLNTRWWELFPFVRSHKIYSCKYGTWKQNHLPAWEREKKKTFNSHLKTFIWLIYLVIASLYTESESEWVDDLLSHRMSEWAWVHYIVAE